jgi:hypothetical protein
LETDRKIALVVGILFIIATVAGVISAIFYGTILTEEDYLPKVSENESQVMLGTVFYLIMAVAVASIAIVMYPYLKRHHGVIALGYVVARVMEGLLFVVQIIAIMALLDLSRDFVSAGAPDNPYYQSIGNSLISLGNWAYILGFGFFFTLSALMLNYVLYRKDLVPRWLSIWGFIGAALIFEVYLAKYYGVAYADVMFVVIAVQEMVFALWLIFKGFNPQRTEPSSG